MNTQKALDHAIMLHETAGPLVVSAGYRIDDRVYENYLSNESWSVFRDQMQKGHTVAYKMYTQGGGKELEERRSGKYTYPPKMASFGSSSRMIYNLMKDVPNFLFEKKLPTTIGGMANLDGFIETESKCVFVEAKCREPYGESKNEIADKYRPLYEAITASHNNNLTCDIADLLPGKMHVDFFFDEKPIQNLDIKQMICHLLGVATAYLQGEFRKPIDFVYLLYNPTHLLFENDAQRKLIHTIYNRECTEALGVDFAGLFYDILVFLQSKKHLGAGQNVAKIAEQFSFRVCDQYTMNL